MNTNLKYLILVLAILSSCGTKKIKFDDAILLDFSNASIKESNKILSKRNFRKKAYCEFYLSRVNPTYNKIIPIINLHFERSKREYLGRDLTNFLLIDEKRFNAGFVLINSEYEGGVLFDYKIYDSYPNRLRSNGCNHDNFCTLIANLYKKGIVNFFYIVEIEKTLFFIENEIMYAIDLKKDDNMSVEANEYIKQTCSTKMISDIMHGANSLRCNYIDKNEIGY